MKTMASRTRIFPIAFALSVTLALLFMWSAGPAEARPAQCFGQKIDRVVKGANKTVRLKFKQVAWVEGENITVIGKPYSVICAGAGRQVIFAGKGTSRTDAGPGNDKIVIHPKSNNNRAYGGLGNDEIIGSNGHDFIYASPKKVGRGVADTDRVSGGGGNDRIYDYGGENNRLSGGTGSDSMYSLGTAVSELHGGNGTDFLYANGGKSKSGVIEKLFGEQGNDKLRADRKPNNGPAYLDGAEGDDKMTGSNSSDILIYNSGIKTLKGLGGDDLFVTSGRGLGKIDGGSGRDTISYAALTTSNTWVKEMGGYISGVKVYLDQSSNGWPGYSVGHTRYLLRGIEDVVGSSFDDYIQGAGTSRIDGGLGSNLCSRASQLTNCNGDSPGNNRSEVLVDVNAGGIPTVLGSRGADNVSIGYNPRADRFEVTVAGGARPSGLCTRVTSNGSRINCPVDPNLMSTLVVVGEDGNDRISLKNSIPAHISTKLDGGNGRNVITGGPSKDLIETSGNSAGSVLKGGKGLDIIYANDRVRAEGGLGTDIFRVVDPCVGATLGGGSGTDSVVFAGPKHLRGVKANLGAGYARWKQGGCSAQIRIGPDIEKLEGTDGNDHLIVGKRHPQQQGRSVLFGRGGIDILDARNGRLDNITVGGGGKRNKVLADKRPNGRFLDDITWGWDSTKK